MCSGIPLVVETRGYENYYYYCVYDHLYVLNVVDGFMDRV